MGFCPETLMAKAQFTSDVHITALKDGVNQILNGDLIQTYDRLPQNPFNILKNNE